jgi:hypothetical protein
LKKALSMKRLEKQKDAPNPKLNPQLSEGSIGGLGCVFLSAQTKFTFF